ncbi:MDR family MFS transporter [Sporomusa malonica]|uniref:Drug resistance transporter, EmrB/QacA subfamily n=1 Tax=Sporomusa malonica TaxID=112901 RepID=A0A1W1YGB4_9FIRM|nr:MDR family MFS transporter [Sporomusa malonica]SMC35193.1 drug resistance transporter, EmrB/QacA subfamily [Sporomusa malonica]
MTHDDTRKSVIGGLLLGILMTSMDNTIVATAIGKVVADLGGLDQIIWITSAYLIASIPSMLIFGRLSDMYGRKLFYITGLTLFIIGSLLCGTAQNMLQLSIYRAIQGLGGGSIMPIAFTIIFDSFPPEQRGKMSALFGAVFGLSSILGPLIGALFADYLNWRWIFYINLPLGIGSMILIYKFYFESFEHKKQKVDWWGALCMVISLVSLLFVLELGGKKFPWDSALILGLLVLSVVSFIVFIAIERKVSSPIIPLDLFKNKLFSATQAAGFFYGCVFILPIVYIPIYALGTFGGSATNAGMILMPMMLSSVIGSQVGGFSLRTQSYRNLMLLSVSVLFSGIFLLSTLKATTSIFIVAAYMSITGLGIGISFPVLTTAAIHGLDIRQRGSANSLVVFFRIIGMTIGLTLLGSAQNIEMHEKLAKLVPPDFSYLNQFDEIRTLLQPETRLNLPPEILNSMLAVLTESVVHIFFWALIFILFAAACIMLMGNSKITDSQFPVEARKEANEACQSN